MRPSSVLASCHPSGREDEEEECEIEWVAAPVCVAGVLLLEVVAGAVGEEEGGPVWARLATAAARLGGMPPEAKTICVRKEEERRRGEGGEGRGGERGRGEERKGGEERGR